MMTGTVGRDARRARRIIWSVAAALGLVLVAVAVAATNQSSTTRSTAFGWLLPASAPASWTVAMTPTGATLAYPPGWHEIESDSGTVSAAPRGPRGAFRGYLNATPRSGRETLANWSRFRVAHVADEGAHDVRLDAAAKGLHFRSGRGSCVIDSYSTSRTRFREIACIVAGSRTTTVVVAAAPSQHWATQVPVLERAVAAFTT